MKRKSLILFLSMAVICVACLAIFAIVTSIPKKPEEEKPVDISSAVNKGNNKGSKEDPYYIYDTETFNSLLKEYGGKTKPVRKKVQEVVYEEITGEEGKLTKVEKKDENGNIVYTDKLDKDGFAIYEDIEGQTEVYHFKFLRDIDFADKAFITLFASENFIGEINGDSKVVKNIKIDVTKENLIDFMYLVRDDETGKEYSARIAIFGTTEGAVIENISFENIEVNIGSDVIDYLKGVSSNDNFNNKYNAVVKEFVVASVIAYAKDTTLKANVSATVKSSNYAVHAGGKTAGVNGIGGVVAFAQNSTISSSSETENANINVTIISDDGNRGYYIGGVAGYLYKSNVTKMNVNATITSVSVVDTSVKDNILYIGGIAGYTVGSNIENSVIDLNVKQTEDKHVNLDGVTSINNDLYNKVAGIVSIVRANNDEQVTKLANVTVNAIINMDCLYGGAVYEVRSEMYKATAVQDETEEDKKAIFLTLENIITNSDVNVIKVYGFGANLLYTNIVYTEGFKYATINDSEYNVKITGNTIMKTVDGMGVKPEDKVKPVFIICSNDASGTVHVTLKDIKVAYSDSIVFSFVDELRLNQLYGGNVKV